jgi:hypothetical protein
MNILLNTFFTIFFTISITSVTIKLFKLHTNKKTKKLELYKDTEADGTQRINTACINRLTNEPTKSTADYEQYRHDILNLQLP